MWVKDYMCEWVNTISPKKTVAEAVKQMVEQKTNGMIVVDKKNRPIGIVSSLKLIREAIPEYMKDASFSKFGAEGTFDKYASKIKNLKVEDFMITDFHSLAQKDAMIEAAAYAAKSKLRMIPVVDKEGNDGKLVGVITRTCIKNALYNAIFSKEPVDPRENNNRKGCCSCDAN